MSPTTSRPSTISTCAPTPARLRQAVEKAKIELSDHPYTTIREEFISGKHHLEIEIARADYEAMILPLLQKTLDCIIAGEKDCAILVDITPYSFGTSAVGEYKGEYRPGVYMPVIRRNTPLPASKSEVFYTCVPGQPPGGGPTKAGGRRRE